MKAMRELDRLTSTQQQQRTVANPARVADTTGQDVAFMERQMAPAATASITIKDRQAQWRQEAAAKKLQEELDAEKAARLADQTKYTDQMVAMGQLQSDQNMAYDQQMSQGSGAYGGTVTGNESRDQVVTAALSLVGTDYAWGGGGYGSRGTRGTGYGTQNVIGVDCSGLTQYAYGTLGLKIPRHSRTQLSGGGGVKTSIKNAKPGDLIGWTTKNGIYGHVAIYIGNGMMVHSPKPGDKVKVVPVTNYLGQAFAVSYLG